MSFHPADLERRLDELRPGLPAPGRYVVALSGGLDSSVLLHALTHLVRGGGGYPAIVAVHVDHGLHEASAQWAEHCERVARAQGVEFVLQRVQVPLDTGEGPEASARLVRYAAFEALLEPDDWLLSAHHENDQAETLLLHLMRGSGLDGLAGISRSRRLGRGWLLRPLLGVARADLEQYASEHALEWIDDPSNAESRYDRNFLRNEVLPLLQTRWPAAAARIARSAVLASESATLLADLAALDIAAAGEPARLDLSVLGALPGPRQRNLLRHAIRRLGLPSPPANRLDRIVDELAAARQDAQPLVEWPGAEARRYRGHLYLRAGEAAAPASPALRLEPDRPPLALGAGRGRLVLEAADGPGIRPAVATAGLLLAWREGGERIRPRGHAASHSLKNLLQEAGVVPWQRARIPLLYSDGRLVAVGDLWIAAEFAADRGYRVRWLDRPPLF